MPVLVPLIIAAVAVLIALVLAYVPMRLLLTHMAGAVSAFIHRQEDRRTAMRGTPDRRRAG